MWARLLLVAAVALTSAPTHAFLNTPFSLLSLSRTKTCINTLPARARLAPALRRACLGTRMSAMSDLDLDPLETFVPIKMTEAQLNSKTLDEWFAQLGAAENSDRTLAGSAIAQIEEKRGGDEAIIDRLFGMLTLKEVLHRRAAVQSLGMIGRKILPRTSDLMLTTSDMTTRASCSKVMGAVALRNPDGLSTFPQDALDGIKKAVTEIPDPVTKVASMSALAQIAGGDMANGYPGCERALDLIEELGLKTEDVSLGLSVANALASIARSNPQWKERIMDTMEKIQAGGQKIEGFQMVDDILNTHLQSLSRGQRGKAPSEDGGMGFAEGFSWGKKDEEEDDEDDEDWDNFKF